MSTVRLFKNSLKLLWIPANQSEFNFKPIKFLGEEISKTEQFNQYKLMQNMNRKLGENNEINTLNHIMLHTPNL